MKKTIFLVLTLCILHNLPAQWYFDGGIGVGGATTTIDGKDVTTGINVSSESAVELNLKIGYDISGISELYLTGEISGVGHRLSGIRLSGLHTDYYIQYNSYVLGAGLIWYPLSTIQISGAIGYSDTNNNTDIPFVYIVDGNGYSLNFSGAYDLSKSLHGLLLGLKYHYSSNDLENSRGNMETSYFGIFARYRFRKR